MLVEVCQSLWAEKVRGGGGEVSYCPFIRRTYPGDCAVNIQHVYISIFLALFHSNRALYASHASHAPVFTYI